MHNLPSGPSEGREFHCVTGLAWSFANGRNLRERGRLQPSRTGSTLLGWDCARGHTRRVIQITASRVVEFIE